MIFTFSSVSLQVPLHGEATDAKQQQHAWPTVCIMKATHCLLEAVGSIGEEDYFPLLAVIWYECFFSCIIIIQISVSRNMIHVRYNEKHLYCK